MSSYKRLIGMLISLVVTILYAGVAELLCTPYDGWFLTLDIPKAFVSNDCHNVMWLCIYLTMSYAMSASIVNKDKLSLLLWGILLCTSAVGVAMIFTVKNILFATVSIALSVAVTIMISHRQRHNSIATCILICWYIYLLGISIIVLFNN